MWIIFEYGFNVSFEFVFLLNVNIFLFWRIVELLGFCECYTLEMIFFIKVAFLVLCLPLLKDKGVSFDHP